MRPLLILALLVAGVAARPAAAQNLQPPWVNLGYALAGTFGDPVLVAGGPLTGGSVLSLSLSNTVEAHYCFVVMGTSAIFVPYKGGTLVPYPHVLLLTFTTPSGTLDILAHFPSGVPSGLPIIIQCWINDRGAPAGRSGSNAVGALTP